MPNDWMNIELERTWKEAITREGRRKRTLRKFSSWKEIIALKKALLYLS
jgi:hypothetical protein